MTAKPVDVKSAKAKNKKKGVMPKVDTSEEGMRRGAKAAMDKVLPSTKVSNKDLGSESAGDAEND